MEIEPTTRVLDDNNARQRRGFKRMLVELEIDSSMENLERLASCYETTVNKENRIHLFEDLIGRGCLVYNNKELIKELVKSLEIIRRVDLIPIVNKYTLKWLNYKFPEVKISSAATPPPQPGNNTSLELATALITKDEATSEEDQDESMSSSDDQVNDSAPTVLISGVVNQDISRTVMAMLKEEKREN